MWLATPEEIADLRPVEPPPLEASADDRVYLPVYFREVVFEGGSAARRRLLGFPVAAPARTS